MSHLPPVVDRGCPECHNAVLGPCGLNPCVFSIWGRSFWEAPFCPCVHQRGETLKGHEGEGTLWTPGPLRKYEALLLFPAYILQHPWVQVWSVQWGVKELEAGALAKARQNNHCVRGEGVLHGSHWGRDRWVRPLERQDWVRQGLSWLERFVPG